jgi:RNA polymerase sigma factor (TIGR02999 family)
MSTQAITALLIDWRGGNDAAFDELFGHVYAALQDMAHRYLRQERSNHTLNTTALVHEVYLKLVDINQVEWQDRAHFMAMAARAMRRVLVSYARKHRAEKRGGGQRPVTLETAPDLSAQRAGEMLELDAALERLALLNERLSQTVELRFFGGLTIDETAEALGTSRNTVKRDWMKAKAWLYQALAEETV